MKETVYKIKFNNFSMSQSVDEIDKLINTKQFHMVVTPNMDFFYLVRKNPTFKQAINQSSLSLVDGKPVMWLARLYSVKFKEKISGSDLAPQLLELADKKQYSVLLLGGNTEVSDLAKKRTEESYPNLKIFNYSPPFGFERDLNQIDKIIDIINQTTPDMVFTCFGAPKQELFLFNNKDKLPNSVYVNLGATVDFLAGSVKRAPRWMSKIGLEWLYRLLKEPKRLFKRYFRDFLMIPVVIFYRIFIFRKKKNNENWD